MHKFVYMSVNFALQKHSAYVNAQLTELNIHVKLD
jgi:hypothetical protein